MPEASENKILIVEDDPVARALMDKILSPVFEVCGVNSGEEAMKKMNQFSPDVVLLDYHLPGMNGLETLMLLKQRKTFHFECIFLTVERDLNLAIEALRKGAYDFIMKPVDTETLKNILQKTAEEVRSVRRKQDLNRELQEYQKDLEALVKKQSEDCLRAVKIAEKANQAKSEFLANMSHELRTPMHGILSYARFGLKGVQKEDPRQLSQYFLEIKECGERLLFLLNNLLDLSALEAGHMNMRFADENLADIVRATVREMTSLAAERNIELEVVSLDFEARATVDKLRMIQVMRNIIFNAVKFSPEREKITIEIAQAPEGRYVISVADHGEGIPEEEMKEVFNRFHRSSRTKQKTQGAGLGLTIAKEIIMRHHGSLWAETNPEGGTIIRMAIPCRQSQDAVA